VEKIWRSPPGSRPSAFRAQGDEVISRLGERTFDVDAHAHELR
jgi:hypothetical protein